MDEPLHDRWRSALPPFDALCLYAHDPLPIADLRMLLLSFVGFLRDSFFETPLLELEDWHEHDGLITQARPSDWSTLWRTLSSDQSLYDARPGDTYVHRAYYPSDYYLFLLRFYVLDENEDRDRPGIWGKFDLSAYDELIDKARFVAGFYADRLTVDRAKTYFDSRYAG